MKFRKQPVVYILASKKNGTLYVGVTSDLQKRVWQHKSDIQGGFTQTYEVHILVYFEIHESMHSAIRREKQLKEWHRKWKIRLIQSRNPTWGDLYDDIASGPRPKARRGDDVIRARRGDEVIR
ncbi:MAG: GIY-YIG nuclease family protein, partial [Anaerolineales bacterium]|nr:GIY-YIG nuclease family protein [Anaerolineales bacterium]